MSLADARAPRDAPQAIGVSPQREMQAARRAAAHLLLQLIIGLVLVLTAGRVSGERAAGTCYACLPMAGGEWWRPTGLLRTGLLRQRAQLVRPPLRSWRLLKLDSELSAPKSKGRCSRL